MHTPHRIECVWKAHRAFPHPVICRHARTPTSYQLDEEDQRFRERLNSLFCIAAQTMYGRAKNGCTASSGCYDNFSNFHG